MLEPLILGVARTHDVGAALVRGNELLVLAEAERVLDEKHASGADKLPPAIRAALQEVGASPADIEAICIADTGLDGFEKHFPPLVEEMHREGIALLGSVSDQDRLPLGPLGVDGLRAGTPLYISCHHASHGAGSAWLGGFEESLNLVLDGWGSCCATAAYTYRNNEFARLENRTNQYLMGWRYQLFGYFVKEIDKATTNVLDLAGKVMGLNAYGDTREDWVRRFEAWFEDTDFKRYESSWHAHQPWFADLLGGLGLHIDSHSARDQALLDATASMQEAFSRSFERYVLGCIDQSQIRNVTLSGGCALNVLGNARVAALSQVDKLYIQPTAGDSGLPIGAAALAHAALTRQPLHGATTGQDNRRKGYNGISLELDVELDAPTAPADDPATAERLASMLSEGLVVGMVMGRAEVGPRALGHRSILAFPTGDTVRDRLNRIKAREWWRPFAPVCRAIDAERYFKAAMFSPYMLLTALVREPYRTQLAAASHDDGTARVQIIPSREDHPLLWDVLTLLEAKTGIGVLVNTSFNVSGKPLLNKASVAIDVFQQRDLDALWIEGSFYIK